MKMKPARVPCVALSTVGGRLERERKSREGLPLRSNVTRCVPRTISLARESTESTESTDGLVRRENP